MLVLTRRLQEVIKIGDVVTVTVLGVRGATVRIGVDAPGSVPVHREEIYERIRAEKSETTAASAPPRDRRGAK